MARTTVVDTFNPQVFSETMQSRLAQKNALMGSMLVATGAAIVTPTLNASSANLGQLIDLPYHGGVGLFEENVADGQAAVPRRPKMTSEQATVTRDTLAFEMTRWSQSAASSDPYANAVDSIMQALAKITDKRLVDAAVAPGVIESVITNATLDYDIVVDAKARFRDEQEDIVAMVVHSEAMRDLLKLKDAAGNPLLTASQNEGEFDRFVGIPIGVSNQVPVTGSVMGAVTEDGTSPPDVTLAGTPSDAWDLKIECTTGGSSDGTAKFRWSTDDGSTFSDIYTIPSGGGAFILDESPQAATEANRAADSLVGINGSTGITATFTNGTYNTDNVYRAEADMRVSSLILKRGALAWWFNQSLLGLQTDKDILVDSDVAAMHLYAAAKRFRRRAGGTQTGVISIVHDVKAYNGVLDD